MFSFMHQTFRFVHTSSILRSVDKSLLAKLRKKTGYSIANCRKALDKHSNDIEKAEEWLAAQAKSEGWAKVASLSERATTQGLLGIHIEGNNGSIVEVSCETDFVARNESFIDFTKHAAKTCTSSPILEACKPFVTETLSEDKLLNLKDGKGTLADSLALMVGSLKENMKLRRAIKIECDQDVDLVGLTHPQTPSLTGKYAAVLALKNPNKNTDIARKLCLHIIGMNPKEIGTKEDFEAAYAKAQAEESKEELLLQNLKNQSEEKDKDVDMEEEKPDELEVAIPETSNILYFQNFIADEDVNVAQVLKDNNMEIVDYVRINYGEN